MDKTWHSIATEEVPIVPGHGYWIPVKAIKPPDPADENNSYEVYDKFGMWPAFEGSDMMMVQHAMPCVTPDLPKPEGELEIGMPIKADSSPFNPDFKVTGYRSGRRSAIIPASYEKGQFDWIIGYDENMRPMYPNPENPQFQLRLKGCGMWIQSDQTPFPSITTQPLPSVHHGPHTMEVRGTAFTATVCNEMYTCPEITKMFDLLGLHHMNDPCGFWLYGPYEGDPAPALQKCCSIFKTIGDRRLEANLLHGLERLIYREISDDDAIKIYERICDVYRAHDFRPPSSTNPAFRRSQNIWKFALNNFNKDHQMSTEGGDIRNMTPRDVTAVGFRPSEEIYAALDGFEVLGLPFVDLAKLFGRLGWEAGRCIACVHRAGFNWGSYQDHTADGMLDNAHADNIAVVPEELADLGGGRFQLLSGLDFDMSFRKEQAVNIWGDAPEPDEALVSKMWSVEFGNMMLNLTGYTASLTGVAKGITPRDPPPCPQLELVWALREITAWEYPRGYQYPAAPGYEHNDITLERAKPFMRYALAATLDVSA